MVGILLWEHGWGPATGPTGLSQERVSGSRVWDHASLELIFDPIGSSKDDGHLKHWHTGLFGHHRLQRDGRLKTLVAHET